MAQQQSPELFIPDDLISRKLAKIRGEKYYFTGKPCSNGHIALRYVSGKACIECGAAKKARWKANNLEMARSIDRRSKIKTYWRDPEKARLQARDWKQEHPDKVREINHKQYVKNKEKNKQLTKRWLAENPTKPAEYQRRWRKRHADRYAAYRANRRTRNRQSMPAWLTDKDRTNIANLYMEAKNLQLTTGVKYHVDHVVPLRGENVCGLHVPWNLQILPEKENKIKSNRLDGVE